MYQICQSKICKTRMLLIFLLKIPGDFNLNGEILKSRKNTVIDSSVNGYLWLTCYLLLTCLYVILWKFLRILLGFHNLSGLIFTIYKHTFWTRPPWWKQLILKKDWIYFNLKLIPDTCGQIVSEATIARCSWKRLFLNVSNIETCDLKS